MYYLISVSFARVGSTCVNTCPEVWVMFMHEHAKGSAYECYTAHLPLDVSVKPPVSVRSNWLN